MLFKKSPSKNILFTGILWAVVYVLCLLVVKEMSPGRTIGILLSFLPVITFALFLYAYIKGISAMDEVERRIQLEATVIAFALVLLMIMTLGLLDLVVILKKEDWSYRHLIPFIFVFYFLGLFISRKKYLGNEKHD